LLLLLLLFCSLHIDQSFKQHRKIDCVWLGNDVGRRNYPLFLFFLNSIMLELALVAALNIALCVARAAALVAPLAFLVFVVVVSGPVGTLWLLHVRLSIEARTTREYLKHVYRSRRANPFAGANIAANLCAACCAPRLASYVVGDGR
jgi:hypothetical protein